MSEQKESSVLFSLKELMNLEEERIRQEEVDRERAAEAERQARMDAERRAREAEEARVRAMEEERRQAEQRQREEQARLSAIQQAEMEKARLDAENAARIEQMRHAQEHEARMRTISQDKSKKRLQIIGAVLGVFLLVALVGGGLAIKAQLDRSAKLEAQLNGLNDERDKLNKKLSEATSPEERARLEAELQANQRKMAELKDSRNTATVPAGDKPKVRRGGGGQKPSKPSAPAAKPCDCTPGDPLCDCL